MFKSDWLNGNDVVDDVVMNALAAIVNRIVTPEDFGAVGDGTTDDGDALYEMFSTYPVSAGGACILIPYGKVYACSDCIDMRSNTFVFGGGTIKSLGGLGSLGTPTGSFMSFTGGVNHITWIGPTLDINEYVNVNGFDIGDVGTGDPVHDIHIAANVVGARIDTALEATNETLYAGGGKGITVQFRARNVYANIMAEDCDIACSVEGITDTDRTQDSVVLDIRAKDSHRTALLLVGSRGDAGGSSLDSGEYLDSLCPGVKVRLRAQGGQDASITHPVTEVVGTNYSNAGIVTLVDATGVDVDVYAAAANRCTLVRGTASVSTIRVSNAMLDNLEDGWDMRPVDTWTPAGDYMTDNVFEANIHAATHSGVLVRPHRSAATRSVVKTRLDVNAWVQGGVGLITQSDGATDEFGASVAYRFCDMRSSPVREIVDISSHNPLPTWADLRHFDNLSANNFIADVDSTPTAAATTTLTAADAAVQVFTGTTTQTVQLSADAAAGQTYTVINQSSGTLSIQSSNGNFITSQFPARGAATYTALVDGPTTGSDWQISSFQIAGSAVTKTVALRDSNGSLVSWSFVATPESTNTTGGTTTLSAGSGQTQVFTGTSTQTVKLATDEIVAGQQCTIVNNSTQTVSVQSSGGNAITTVTTNTLKVFVAQVDTPTTAAHWRAI